MLIHAFIKWIPCPCTECLSLSLVSLRYLFLASTLLLIITLVISIHKLKFEETEGEFSVRHYLFLCIRLGWISSLSR